MENKKRFYDRVFLLVTALLAFLVFTSACGSKKTAKKVPRPGAVQPGAHDPGVISEGGCSSCMGSALLLRTQSIYESVSHLQAMVVTLDILGEASPQYNFDHPKVAIGYYGPIYAKGKAVIAENNWRLCNAPQGEYILSAEQSKPGVWQSTVVNNLRLVSQSGPTKLVIHVYNGTPYNINTINKNELNHMGAWFVIESVGDRPCGEQVRFY